MSSDLYWFIVADRNVGHGRVLSLVRIFQEMTVEYVALSLKSKLYWGWIFTIGLGRVVIDLFKARRCRGAFKRYF